MQTDSSHTEYPEQFALLVIGALQLLIPQSDIYSLEPTVDMRTTEEYGIVGRLEQMGQSWSVYALSADLTLLSDCPERDHIIVLLKNVQPAYGLLCEQITMLARSEISIHPLPTVMRSVVSPFLALAIRDEELLYISSASTLSQLLPLSQNG